METRNSKAHTILARLAALLLTLGMALGFAPAAHAVYIPLGRTVTVTDNRNGGKVTGTPTSINRNVDGSIASVDGTVTKSTDPLVTVGSYRVIVVRTADGKKTWTLHKLSGAAAASDSSTPSSSSSAAASPSETAADSDASASDAAGSDTGSELVMSGGVLVLQDEDGNLVDLGATVEDSGEDAESDGDQDTASASGEGRRNTLTLAGNEATSSSTSAEDATGGSVAGVVARTLEENATIAAAAAAVLVAVAVVALAAARRRRIRAANVAETPRRAPRHLA